MTSSSPAPLVSFSCQPNSHPFEERQVVLSEAVKIGRSVARARPIHSNAIFDCKVLSRNHALVWYEDGKFWMKDTKSSNGTFVNSHRLSKGAEESSPRQLYSGDIIQFGVDVVENSTTHGCIIAQLSLFFPDGTEAKRTDNESQVSTGSPGYSNLSQEQVYQLAQYLQEALYREQTLQQKLDTLQKVLETSEEASVTGWQVLLNEERLLAKLELLENQLQLYVKNYPEDMFRAEASRAFQERYELERQCQTVIERLLEEKAKAQRRETLLESRLESAECESSLLRERCTQSHDQLNQLSEERRNGDQDCSKLQDKLQEAEMRVNHLTEVENERSNLEMKIEELQRELDVSQVPSTKTIEIQGNLLQLDEDKTFALILRLQDELTALDKSLPLSTAPDDEAVTSPTSHAVLERLKELLQKVLQTHQRSCSTIKTCQDQLAGRATEEAGDNTQTDCQYPACMVDSGSMTASNTSVTAEETRKELDDLQLRLHEEKMISDDLRAALEVERQHAEKLAKEISELQARSSSSIDTIGADDSSVNNSAAASCDVMDDSSEDLPRLSAECDRLRDRVLWIEADMRASRDEQDQLGRGYARVQIECRQLRQQLKVTESDSCEYPTLVCRKPGVPSSTSLESLQSQCLRYQKELSTLKAARDVQLRDLSYKTRMVSAFAILPIMILVGGLMGCLYFRLAFI